LLYVPVTNLRRVTVDSSQMGFHANIQHAAKKYPQSCLPFSEQPLGIAKRNLTQILPVHTYLKGQAAFDIFLLSQWLRGYRKKIQWLCCRYR